MLTEMEALDVISNAMVQCSVVHHFLLPEYYSVLRFRFLRILKDIISNILNIMVNRIYQPRYIDDVIPINVAFKLSTKSKGRMR
ncbi:hypothetical protein CEXT_424001 [Caerostris extrusa]|uniref:Uncharacterized protein n=1 Tax=Caerostris extrusa TaxID=172846 RepID=A0AAV4XFE8_CAEEX|nr:hypothetical protein CEXT_424001 [Caerostris extrusa]